MRTLALALAVSAMGAADAAPAAVVTAPNVVSPSKLISCHAVKYRGPAISCSASYLPRIGELDPYLRLGPRGETSYGERGDYDGYAAAPRTLRYGDRWRRAGVECAMARSGLTCRNRDGHGFRLAKGDVRRF